MKSLRAPNFSLKDTIECGQTFCWVQEGEGYVNADIGQVVYVEQKGDYLYWESSEGPVDLRTLFRLHDPLKGIHEEIAKDDLMVRSIKYAPGLRIIKDPFYPCLVSFLCSTWSNIPKIHYMVRQIRKRYGPSYELRGKTFYGIPLPETIVDACTVSDLRSCGLGWRSEFIIRSTRMLLEEEYDSEILASLSYEDTHERLKRLHGVGHKVADCIQLFSLGQLEAFPIDVWIERVIEQYYGIFTETGKSYKKKSIAARSYFGKYAGYAQEYLFYFTRTKGLE